MSRDEKYKNANLIMKMDENTFNEISEGKIGGFRATVTGRLTFRGPLRLITKFDSNVIKRYFGDLENQDQIQK